LVYTLSGAPKVVVDPANPVPPPPPSITLGGALALIGGAVVLSVAFAFLVRRVVLKRLIRPR